METIENSSDNSGLVIKWRPFDGEEALRALGASSLAVLVVVVVRHLLLRDRSVAWEVDINRNPLNFIPPDNIWSERVRQRGNARVPRRG
jgi:hypothetical protein